ncbi:MAG: RNase adaptor protein RapZ, partial [Proteobacteria bacterium]|nr:RNase adaptor protein RapZ [Pseudomonadota bacterium]
ARLLPNPHWSTELRALTGKDQAVVDFLRDHKDVGDFIASITAFLTQWLPLYERSQRTYVTVAIGCTGGQHRSVFVAEEVFSAVRTIYGQTQIRHRELRAMVAE